MKFFIYFTSKKHHGEVRSFNSLKDVLNLHIKDENDIIIKDNFWFEEKPRVLMDYYGNYTLEEAMEIVSCEYAIEIYDLYKE